MQLSRENFLEVNAASVMIYAVRSVASAKSGL